MAYYNVISIGGTGARCTEALIHLCAVGLGPEQLSIMFIDPDKSNGNLTRTRSLVKHYNRCRAILQKSSDPELEALFKTELIIPEQDTWNIFDIKGEDTLRRFLKVDTLPQSNKELLAVLFSEHELDTNLDVGFRGHPSIGAVVMSQPDDNKEPWKSFWGRIDSAQNARDVRIFLFGSIFGGTGAAGFPTLSYIIKSDKRNIIGEDTRIGSKIHLGGALLLPYFRFANPIEADVSNQLYVKVDDFPLAAKAALNYYSEKDLGLDEIYFIGDSTEIDVGAFSVGASEQHNKSHYIELVSALACIDFYSNMPKNDDEPKFFLAGREREDVRIDWSSIPSSRKSGDSVGKEKVRKLIANFIQFAYTLCQYIEPTISNKESIDDKQAWFKKNFTRYKLNPRDNVSREKIENINNYAAKFIDWCSDISEAENIKLFNMSKLKADRRDKYAIAQLLAGQKTEKQFSKFISAMNDIIISNEVMDPASRLINLVYLASDRFYKA
jgi:hypothetical protein